MANATKKNAPESALREKVNNPDAEDGAVVVFLHAEYPDQKKKRNQNRHPHVAIYDGKRQRWSVVGSEGTYVQREHSHAEFIQVLSGPNVISADLVTATAAIKP